MKILDLVLKAKWYDMIESGEKTEEYRIIKPYWEKRLLDYKSLIKSYKENRQEFLFRKLFFTQKAFVDKICDRFPRGYDAVRFHYGYTKRTMIFQCLGITIGKGNPDWGAPDEDVFIISLGKRLE